MNEMFVFVPRYYISIFIIQTDTLSFQGNSNHFCFLLSTALLFTVGENNELLSAYIDEYK